MQQLSEFVINHWILVTAFCAVAGLLIANLVGTARGVSPLEAVNLINREDAVVVDVRAPEEFARGHLAGAINLPQAELEQARARLGAPAERPLLVCCQSGTTAGAATRRLRSAGYARAQVLAGGINAWRAANLPLSTS